MNEERAVIRKVTWRLIPFLCFVYFIAYLDRVNVGFAALTMRQDLALSATAYGVGAGIFFVGYFLFEVPSNYMLKRLGARVWIARIMFTWGAISMATAFVQGPVSFNVMRFLLGVAEAGFFPGMVYYLTCWFPLRVRAVILGIFIIANPASAVIGAPLSTQLLDVSLFGLAGWQTMFLVEGAPAVLLGFAVLAVLRDSPEKASWLSDREREVLTAAVTRDEGAALHTSWRAGIVTPVVWHFAVLYFLFMLAVYGFGLWAPQIIGELGGFTTAQTGWVVGIPYTAATIAMWLWGRHSDQTSERRWHLAIPGFIGAAGFAYATVADDLYLSLAAFSVGAMGIYSSLPLFWTVLTRLLGGAAAAAGIAVINSVGNLAGGLGGPVLMGWLKDRTQGYAAGLLIIAASLAFAALYSLHLSRPKPVEIAPV
jgi:MFS transporter, ACS family, tartrate transporter